MCQRGLSALFRKQMAGKPARRFKSCRLRQISALRASAFDPARQGYGSGLSARGDKAALLAAHTSRGGLAGALPLSSGIGLAPVMQAQAASVGRLQTGEQLPKEVSSVNQILLFVARHEVVFLMLMVVLTFGVMVAALTDATSLFVSFVLLLLLTSGLFYASMSVDAPAIWFTGVPRAEAVWLKQDVDRQHTALSIQQFASITGKFRSQKDRSFLRQQAALSGVVVAR